MLPVERGSNGYREYGAAAPLILEIIATARLAGFSLDEIEGILPDGTGRWDRERLVSGLETKGRDIAELASRLESTARELSRLTGLIRAQPLGNECLDNIKQALELVRPAAYRADIRRR